VYPPKSVYLTNFYVVTGCLFSLTQDKFDIVAVCALARDLLLTYTPQFIPPPPNEIRGYAPASRYVLQRGDDGMLLAYMTSGIARDNQQHP